MLKIEVNNQEVDLGSLKGITLKFAPGIFENDTFDASLTIPFTIPGSDINNVIFGFPYKTGNANKDIREYQMKLWHSGLIIKEGTVKAFKFPYGEIHCIFYIDNGNVYKDFNTTNLNENNLGGYKSWVTKSEYSYVTDDFVMYRVRNAKYYAGTYEESNVTSNATNQNIYLSNAYYWNQGTPTILTPFPLLWRVLQYLFINKGFRYFDSFFSSGYYRTINIFNTVNVLEPDTYESAGQYYTRNKLTRYNLANHLPAINTTDFINAIQKFFNVFFYIRDSKVQVIDRKALINSTAYSDLTAKTIGNYTKELQELNYDGVAFSILRDENDDNLSILRSASDYESVNLVSTDPMLAYGTIPYKSVLYFENILSSTNKYAQYYQWVNEKDVIPAGADNWYWRSLYDQTTDYYQAIDMSRQQGIYFGARRFELEQMITPIGGREFGIPDPAYTYFYPVVKQPGNSWQHYVTNPFSLRLMCYNGKRTVEGVSQPHGTSSAGDVEISSYWSYINRWKDYIDWWIEANKEHYEQDFQFTASELKNFNFAEKKLIGNSKYFITEMQVQLLRKEIGPTQAKMIKAE